MKFLADMGISPKTVHWLKTQGYDAVHLVEQGLETLSDEDILEKAKIENRIILTVDLDFGNLLAIQKASFPSVILFRLGNQYYSLINEKITLVLQNYSEILKTGAIVSVTDQTIRVKKLPI